MTVLGPAPVERIPSTLGVPYRYRGTVAGQPRGLNTNRPFKLEL